MLTRAFYFQRNRPCLIFFDVPLIKTSVEMLCRNEVRHRDEECGRSRLQLVCTSQFIDSECSCMQLLVAFGN